MNVVHQVIHKSCQKEEPGGGPEVSVLSRLGINNNNNINSNKNNSIRDNFVNKLRQDFRILNARNRRLMDKKLIIFLVSISVLFILCGSIMLGAYFLCDGEYKHVQPVIVIGPVLIGAGLMTILLSSEICVRYYRESKRSLDPELDNLTNPQEVKHWIDPRIIPFGWGTFDSGEFQDPKTKDVSCIILPILSADKDKEEDSTRPGLGHSDNRQ